MCGLINDYTHNKGYGGALKVKSLYLRYILTFIMLMGGPIVIAFCAYKFLHFLNWIWPYIYCYLPWIVVISVSLTGAAFGPIPSAMCGCGCFCILPLVILLAYLVGSIGFVLYYPFCFVMLLLTICYHCQRKGNRNAN